MFREKRSDTRVETVERTYGIELHSRGDMLLGNLLEERGFESLSQLLKAYRGNLIRHARRRRVFLSFHAEDIQQVQGLRLMAMNPGLELDFYDGGVREIVDSENSSYIRKVIREKIARASVLLCLVGNGTAWRDWVDWEIRTACGMGKGVCGIRLKGSRGRTPPALADLGVTVSSWDPTSIVAVVEQAAAKRT